MTIQTTQRERRHSLRLDKVFPVVVESELHGFSNCIARNISTGGIFLQAQDLLPLGSAIRIYFSLNAHSPGIAAQGTVKNHYHLNFGPERGKDGHQQLVGMGVRFSSFEDDGMDRLSRSISATSVPH